jgi:tetratricopeptide (TPR) repeat protein
MARGHLTEGRARLEALIAAAPLGELRSELARAANAAAVLAWAQGDHLSGRRLHEQGLALSTEIGDRWGIAFAQYGLGNIDRDQGDLESATTRYTECLAVWQELGDDWGTAVSYGSLGSVARMRGDYAEAEASCSHALDAYRRLGDKWGVAVTLHALASAALNQDDLERARRLYEDVLGLARQLGQRSGIASSLGNLAIVSLEQGDISSARRFCAESLSAFIQLGDTRGITQACEATAWITAAEGRPFDAALLLAAAEAMREKSGRSLDAGDAARHRRAEEAVRNGLRAERLEHAGRIGRGMPADAAISRALEALHSSHDVPQHERGEDTTGLNGEEPSTASRAENAE